MIEGARLSPVDRLRVTPTMLYLLGPPGIRGAPPRAEVAWADVSSYHPLQGERACTAFSVGGRGRANAAPAEVHLLAGAVT